MSTPFLKGYAIKPAAISNNGIVTFTDGVNNIQPNQLQCEAYGYKYDIATRTCYAFNYSSKLAQSNNNTNNNIRGSQNETEVGTNNTYIMGERNIAKSNTRNNIITGNSNQISTGVNNAAVFGNFGIANRAGEIVFGGGGFNGAGKGFAQNSILTLTGTTTDATSTSLFVNGNPDVTAIDRTATNNLFTAFEAKVVGVRTGGSAAGSEGDRIFLTTSGVAYETTVDESTPVIVSTGTVTGWTANVDFSGSNMLFKVTGAANMNISWSCTLNIYELQY